MALKNIGVQKLIDQADLAVEAAENSLHAARGGLLVARRKLSKLSAKQLGIDDDTRDELSVAIEGAEYVLGDILDKIHSKGPGYRGINSKMEEIASLTRQGS